MVHSDPINHILTLRKCQNKKKKALLLTDSWRLRNEAMWQVWRKRCRGQCRCSMGSIHIGLRGILQHHITACVCLWCRGEDPKRGSAEWVSGGDGDGYQEVFRGAGAAAGSQGWAGLWEGGEEQLHLSTHWRTKPAKGASGAVKEKEETERGDVSGSSREDIWISECFILIVVL